MREFIFEYEWNGSTYATIIPARDAVEADLRAQAMTRGLFYVGESVLRVKVANSEDGWWARFVKYILGVRP